MSDSVWWEMVSGKWWCLVSVWKFSLLFNFEFKLQILTAKLSFKKTRLLFYYSIICFLFLFFNFFKHLSSPPPPLSSLFFLNFISFYFYQNFRTWKLILGQITIYIPVHFMYRAEFPLSRASSTVQIQTIWGKTGLYAKWNLCEMNEWDMEIFKYFEVIKRFCKNLSWYLTKKFSEKKTFILKTVLI